MNRSLYLVFATSSLVSTVAAAQPAGGDTDSTPAAEPTAATPDSPAEPIKNDKQAAAPAPAGDTKPSTLGDTGAATSPFTWEPFGFLRLQYIFVQNDPNVAFVGRDDGFELQNARFGVRGAYAERVRYVMSVDGAVDERAQQNTPEGKLRVGLRDAYADVLTGGKAFIRGGFFQTWADPSRLISDTNREFVDRPLWSRGMRSTEGWYTPGLTPGRSIGAAFRIEPEQPMQVGFELAVQNGADEFASNNDNDLPAVNGAVMFRLPDNGFIVAGARVNPRTVGELPFRQDELDLQGMFGLQINSSAVHIGAGGLVQQTKYQSTSGPDQNGYGAHAEVLFRVPAGNPVWLGYRFGILDPSSLILTDRVMEHTLGGVIAVPSLRMRFQLQATHVMEQSARELSNTRVQVAAEVAL